MALTGLKLAELREEVVRLIGSGGLTFTELVDKTKKSKDDLERALNYDWFAQRFTKYGTTWQLTDVGKRYAPRFVKSTKRAKR